MHVTIQELCMLQRNTNNIRNICIMAHVDHGKTSLADCLLMSNGIVSESAIGERRYMDSRPDEQKRGITMKSSSILLKFSKEDEDYLINLIDTPGHVDFSSEVSCAVRLCDGVIIVVDVVEGICPQTRAVVYQAYIERMEMILFLNKIDRLINDLGMDPIDAYHRMYNIVEQMNALINSFHTKEIESFKYHSDIEMAEDPNSNHTFTNIHTVFNPIRGNVLFGSAVDGWAFRLQSFSSIYSSKIGLSENKILSRLWGDYCFDPKIKKFSNGAISRNRKPCFVQFILENIWQVYSAFKNSHNNDEILRKIYKFIGVEPKSTTNVCETNHRQLTKEFMRNWLPLYDTTLSAVITHHPSPCSLSRERIIKLMSNDSCAFENLPVETRSLMQDFIKCSSNKDAPVIVYISKMLLVNSTDSLHQIAKPVEPTKSNQVKMLDDRDENKPQSNHDNTTHRVSTIHGELEKPHHTNEKGTKTKLIAFARIFSGSLSSGTKLYVIMPRFTTKSHQDHINIQNCGTIGRNDNGIVRITLTELYIIMGINFELCDYIPCGNIVGIGGLDDVILKSATISSSLYCPSFSPMTFHVNPIVKISIEPMSYKDLHKLTKALETLELADSNLIYQLEDTGESVLYVTGEVHLQRCITDLEEIFDITDIKVSNPIVPFKETIATDSCIGKDMITQISPDNYFNSLPSFISEQFDGCKFDSNSNCPISSTKSVQVEDREGNFLLKMRCICIPLEVQDWIDKVQQNRQYDNTFDFDIAKNNLKLIIDSISNKKLRREWTKIWDRIWFFGTKNAPHNLLVDNLKTRNDEVYFHQLKTEITQSQSRTNSMSSGGGLVGIIHSGFCMAINSGSLMEESLTGVCFIIENIMLNNVYDPKMLYQTNLDINTSGKLMALVKQCCRCSYLASGSVRLSLPMYETTLYLSSSVMGKAYAVLGRREAKIIREELLPETNIFTIVAQMPVVESFGFSAEILTKCRGLAQPQMSFSHWEILDIDPFWLPGTEEEIELHGKAELHINIHNIAMEYIRAVRKRKGLSTGEKIVEHAEKQRTVKKNK